MLQRKFTMILSAPSKYFVATSQVLPQILVILFSLSSLYLLFFSPIFKITKVECYQDVETSCQNSFVIAAANDSLGNNLFRFDTQVALDRIRRGDPTIRSLEYKKFSPAP